MSTDPSSTILEKRGELEKIQKKRKKFKSYNPKEIKHYYLKSLQMLVIWGTFLGAPYDQQGSQKL